MLNISKYDELFGSSRFTLREVFKLDLISQTSESLNRYESIQKGHFGFICKHCKVPGIMRIDEHVCMGHQTKKKWYDRELFYQSSYNITCPKCGINVEYKYLLDPAITPVIATLNSKGYVTLFSCQGHHDQSKEWLIETKNAHTYSNASSDAYIAFKEDIMCDSVLKLYPLPKTWSYNPSEEYNENMVVIRAKDGVDRQTYLRHIYDWGCRLPNINRGSSAIRVLELMREIERLQLEIARLKK